MPQWRLGWITVARRELLIDAGLGAAVTLIVAVAITADIGGTRGPDVGAYLFAVGLGLLMFIRRRHPVLTLIATGVGITGYYIADYPPIGLALPMAAALYSAAERGRLVVAASTAAVLLFGSLIFRIGGEGEGSNYLLGYELPWSAAIMAGALALGDGVRNRHLQAARQREREQEQSRQQEYFRGGASTSSSNVTTRSISRLSPVTVQSSIPLRSIVTPSSSVFRSGGFETGSGHNSHRVSLPAVNVPLSPVDVTSTTGLPSPTATGTPVYPASTLTICPSGVLSPTGQRPRSTAPSAPPQSPPPGAPAS